MATKVHAAQQLFLITAVLILGNWQQAQANQTVYVDSTEQCQDDYQCNNFTYLLHTSTIFTSNSTVFFLPGRHFITAYLPVSNITNLVLRGPEVSPDKSPVAHIIIRGENFYFEDVSNLTLQCITITSEQCNGLQLQNINSMVMDSVHVVGSCGHGLYAHNILGNFSIRNCRFLNSSVNSLLCQRCADRGGNAKITYDGFNDVKHNVLQVSHSEFGYGKSQTTRSSGGLYIEVILILRTEQYYLSITVSDCIFHDNKAIQGANMNIKHFNNRNLQQTISIINSSFVSGIAEESGGGLYIDYIGNDNGTSNVYINNSTFWGNLSRSFGGGLLMITVSTRLLIHIVMSTFIGNEVRDYDIGGGGGILLKVSTLSSPQQNVTKIVVSNTIFEGNKANALHYDRPSAYNHFVGGGLYLDIGGAVVVIEYCRFNSNFAVSGSGIAILLQSTSTLVKQCRFISGSANMGGAVSILLDRTSHEANDSLQNNIMTISDSFFQNNSAILGGAVYFGAYYWTKYYFMPAQSTLPLMFKSSYFFQNIATYGGAIHVDHGQMSGVYELSIAVDKCIISNNYAKIGAVLNIIAATTRNILSIIQCQIQNNVAEVSVINITSNIYVQSTLWIINSQFSNNTVAKVQYNTATVYLLHVSECYICGTAFSANSASSVLANHSNISLEGDVVFKGNTAFAGAALLLDCPPDSLHPSFLNLLPNSTVIITNNTALHSGGGIAINSECNYDNHCFFKFQSPPESGPNHHVFMDSNSAIIAGNSIYGPSIEHCTVADNISGYTAFATPFEVEQDVSNIVFAKAFEVCFCGVNFEKRYKCSTNSQVDVRSGQEFNISAVVTWPFQELPSLSFIRSHLTTKSAHLGLLQDIQELQHMCSNLTFSVTAPTFTTAQIKLTIEFANTAHSSLINIKLLDCPVGFKMNDKFKCDCDLYLTSRVQGITCDINTNTLTIPGNVWIGNYTKDKLLAHPYCPLDYCNPQTHSLDLQNQDQQCTSNRSDILCGACRNGFSLTLGTVNCLDNCSHYYLFLIIPFALAGVLFVVLLLKCNLTVSTGTVNALIFYANIIHVNSTIFFPKSKTILLTQFLSVFLAWINLDLGIEICFYKGMNAYAITWLQFVFPVYIWMLVLIMIYSSRYYVIASKLIGRNAVSVLATLFLLSYAKLLRTIIAAVSSIRVRDEDGTSHLLWLIDGNVPYFSGPHVALFIMAVLAVLLYIIPLTLLTLLAPCLQARTNHWMMRWVVRIKPLLDAFLGPYKDKYRYWTGVMLIVRVILFTVFAANTVGDPKVNLFAIIVLNALIIILQAYKTIVYRSHLNSVLECFFNLNLCIFSTATLSLTSSERSSEYLACVMVGSSFIVFCCIILWHFNQKTNLIDRVIDKIKSYARMRRTDDNGKQTTDPPPPPQRQAQPTVSVIDMRVLREPLLTNN